MYYYQDLLVLLGEQLETNTSFWYKKASTKVKWMYAELRYGIFELVFLCLFAPKWSIALTKKAYVSGPY